MTNRPQKNTKMAVFESDLGYEIVRESEAFGADQYAGDQKRYDFASQSILSP